MLHPRHKLDYFKKAGWEEEWIVAAQKIVREEYERSYAPSCNEDESESEVCDLSFFFLWFIFLMNICRTERINDSPQSILQPAIPRAS